MYVDILYVQELISEHIYEPNGGYCLYMGHGFDSHRGQKNFFFTSCGSLIPFTRADAQWVFHGLYIAL